MALNHQWISLTLLTLKQLSLCLSLSQITLSFVTLTIVKSFLCLSLEYVLVLKLNYSFFVLNYFFGIMNQVRYIDNQFNVNFQPISLHVVNNFTIWYPYSQFHKINFIKCINLFYKERYIMYNLSFLIAPHEWLYQKIYWPHLSNRGSYYL